MKRAIFSINIQEITKVLKKLHTVQREERYEIESFFIETDMKNPLHVPHYLQELFKLIKSQTKKFQNNVKAHVYLIDKETDSQLFLQRENSVGVWIKLAEGDLAQIEELLLECGFKMENKNEIHTIFYEYAPLNTTFQLTIWEILPAYLEVIAPNEIQLKKALTLLHFDISQTKIMIPEDVLKYPEKGK